MENIRLNGMRWSDSEYRDYVNSLLQTKGTIRFYCAPSTLLNIVTDPNYIESKGFLQKNKIYISTSDESGKSTIIEKTLDEINIFLEGEIKIREPIEVNPFTFIYICDEIDISTNLISFEKLLREYNIEGKIENNTIGINNRVIIIIFTYKASPDLSKIIIFCDTSRIFKDESKCLQFNESLLKLLEKGEV